jgi:hypothetical protein
MVAAGSLEAPLRLSGTRPVAVGVKRAVFQHPEDPDLLVKVLHPAFIRKRFGPTGSYHNRHRRCLHYNYFLRELREYLVTSARSPEALSVLPEVVGLVHTDMGLGLVVKKVSGPDGRLAPTIGAIVASGGLDARRRVLLDELERIVVDSEAVIDDLHPGNIVLTRDASGSERFVLIDGLGSSTTIPLKALVRFINRMSKRKAFRKLRGMLDYLASSTDR